MSRENKYEIDMCNGSIMDKLISFALPLMLSSMLQLMFNAVDIVVVGRFSGSQSLAAVGATTALIYLFTNLFIGISLGANVLAARYYAAGKHEEMSETVHTAMMFALISGIIMIFVGLFFSRLALEIMGTPSYETAADIPDYFRSGQCMLKYVACYCIPSGRGRSCNCNGDFTIYFLCTGNWLFIQN